MTDLHALFLCPLFYRHEDPVRSEMKLGETLDAFFAVVATETQPLLLLLLLLLMKMVQQ